jgi:hypothetical protein
MKCRASGAGAETDYFRPVVSAAISLLTELDPDDAHLAYGLCDFAMGCPEIGRVRVSEIAAVTSPGGQLIESDHYFKTHKALQAYADEARRAGRVVA